MVPQFVLKGKEFASSHQWILAYVAHALAEDLTRRPSPVVIIEGIFTQTVPARYVDLPGYFLPFAEFRDTWSHYRFERNLGACLSKKARMDDPDAACEFKLYRRTP